MVNVASKTCANFCDAGTCLRVLRNMTIATMLRIAASTTTTRMTGAVGSSSAYCSCSCWALSCGSNTKVTASSSSTVEFHAVSVRVIPDQLAGKATKTTAPTTTAVQSFQWLTTAVCSRRLFLCVCEPTFAPARSPSEPSSRSERCAGNAAASLRRVASRSLYEVDGRARSSPGAATATGAACRDAHSPHKAGNIPHQLKRQFREKSRADTPRSTSARACSCARVPRDPPCLLRPPAGPPAPSHTGHYRLRVLLVGSTGGAAHRLGRCH